MSDNPLNLSTQTSLLPFTHSSLITDQLNEFQSLNTTSMNPLLINSYPSANSDKETTNPAPGYLPNSLFGSFTKSRNWAQKLVDEVADLIFVITAQGNIVFASSSSRSLVGFSSDEIVHHHISEFIHPDDARQMVLSVTQAAQEGTPFHLIHRYRRKNADYTILDIQGRLLPNFASYLESKMSSVSNQQQQTLSTLNPIPYIVSVGREYPGKLSPFLDAVLDLKIEHERLNLMKLDLQHGAGPPPDLSTPLLLPLYQPASLSLETDPLLTSLDNSFIDQIQFNGPLLVDSRMPPVPIMPVGQTQSTMNIFGTDLVGPESLSSSSSVASASNQAWFNASFPVSGKINSRNSMIDPLSGTSPMFMDPGSMVGTNDGINQLMVNSVNNACNEPIDNELFSKKRKKRKDSEVKDRVCIDCGTTQSPEWRKGPTGAKTLCNACGLRYAKRVKTEQQSVANHSVDYIIESIMSKTQKK